MTMAMFCKQRTRLAPGWRGQRKVFGLQLLIINNFQHFKYVAGTQICAANVRNVRSPGKKLEIAAA